MKGYLRSYSLFYKFIEAYAPRGFKGIDRNDALVLELEDLTENNNQFFFAADIIQIKINFTSNRSIQIIGVEPNEISPYHFLEATHPDDIQRHGLARAKLFSLAMELFIAEKGTALLSANLKVRNSEGGYSNHLIQCYLFYSALPIKTVYLIQIHTDIESFKKSKNAYHYYVGNDLSNFRYPDEELLNIGNPLSDREFEIVKLIATGLSSEQVAAQLFLSIHTINTHRGNILTKTGFNTISELIIDFQKRGLL